MIDRTPEYFHNLDTEVKKIYVIANEARGKGLDPVDKVEIPLAMSMAEKVVGLISTIYPQMTGVGISERILELEKEHGKLDPAVCLQIAEEIAKQKFCKFSSLLEAIDAGTRVGFAYTTLGVVSSPIEGLTEVKLMKTQDGKEYLSPFYSGPVRSAGGTGAAFSLVILDHLREIFGYAKYDPTEEEIKRTVSEIVDYQERITNLQYFPTEQEIILLAKNIPIQISGEASEKLEVSNYKNLPRIETNFLRSGFCLVLAEGLAQKAAKIKRYVDNLRKKGYKLSAWDFLNDYIELHKKRDTGKTDNSPTYLNDIVAGRPVFGHPSRSGAFRFRYGRGRVSGFSATSLHPATMAITDSFIAIGTQLKIEKPTKGCVTTPCDLIDGPIVKFANGSVKKLNSYEEAIKAYPNVVEIIYLGDVLFPFSDLSNRNANLFKPGYVEEWWALELREKKIEAEKNLNCYKISLEKAIEISNSFSIPMHPSYIYYWTQISKEEFSGLIDWLQNARIDEKIILPYSKLDREKFKIGKRALELLGVEHEVTIENVVLDKTASSALLINLGIDYSILSQKVLLKDFINLEKFTSEQSVLEIINSVSKFVVKDKAGDFMGARMGRPEKAKLRKLIGSPNMLFPVGNEGGRLRSLNAACETGKIKSSFPLFFCETCKKNTIYPTCEICSSKCKKLFYCRDCDSTSTEMCKEHSSSQEYQNREIDIAHYLTAAVTKLGISKSEIPPLIKGVRGTFSGNHDMENLGKGILRAMQNLQVNKDGTIRFDATELPIVAFKPKEIFVSVEKLKSIGYTHDIHGAELVEDNQILELMPHDIILPSSYATTDERADDVFMAICRFVDSLLVKFYGMKPLYNVRKREDLVGQLGVCMAPHNCAGVICRFIGFSNTLGILASPFMHAAIRRDCDGDEAAIMLLGDVLLNFSRKFLPSHRGGTQDAPLVLNGKIDAGEVDDQILDFELTSEYPLELYRLAEQRKHSSEMKGIPNVKSFLKEGKNPFVGIGHTHDVSDFNTGVPCSFYKLLESMQDKVEHEMALVEKLRSVDTSDVARLIIDRHFMRDLKGNLKKFSMQGFRCVACNEIMRRPPLTGVCNKCGGKLIFTINEGGIKKYLDPALNLAKKYNLSNYLQQNLQIVKENIDSVFGKELDKQEALEKWF